MSLCNQTKLNIYKKFVFKIILNLLPSPCVNTDWMKPCGGDVVVVGISISIIFNWDGKSESEIFCIYSNYKIGEIVLSAI